MDNTDADMMEAQPSNPPSPLPPPLLPLPLPPLQVPPPNSDKEEVVKGLLTLARQLVHQGQASQSLQAVAMAMRTKGGDEALFEVLNRAQELYRSKLQASSPVDELASLFAECAIAEALPSQSKPSHYHPVLQPIEPDAHGTSILAETGRKQIMLDAFSDGSSFVCLQCGGLVSNQRKDEHYAFWCCKI